MPTSANKPEASDHARQQAAEAELIERQRSKKQNFRNTKKPKLGKPKPKLRNLPKLQEAKATKPKVAEAEGRFVWNSRSQRSDQKVEAMKKRSTLLKWSLTSCLKLRGCCRRTINQGDVYDVWRRHKLRRWWRSVIDQVSRRAGIWLFVDCYSRALSWLWRSIKLKEGEQPVIEEELASKED